MDETASRLTALGDDKTVNSSIIDATEEEHAIEREARIDALLDFQRAELTKVLSHRDAVDEKIRLAHEAVEAAADHLSAARALVAARAAGSVLHEDPALAVPVAPRPDITISAKSAERDGAVTPIGVLFTSLRKRWEAPRQAFVGACARGVLVLRDEYALHAKPGDRLVIVYWLDRNGGLWRTHVRPPRHPSGRVGVLATRAPHRPTPVGLSLCVVEKVECGTTLHLSGLDILDETPVLSVRRYEKSDALPDTKAGWLEDETVVRPLHYDTKPEERAWKVVLEERAAERLDFVERKSNADVRDVVIASLACGAGRKGVLPIGAFRVLFERNEQASVVRIVDVVSGFREAVCEAESDIDPEALLHAQFKLAYP